MQRACSSVYCQRMNRWQTIIRTLLWNDVVITTLLICLATLFTCTVVFVLTWMIYNERHGISLGDYARMVLT